MWRTVDIIIIILLATMGTAFVYDRSISPPDIKVTDHSNTIEFIRDKQVWKYSKNSQTKFLDVRLFSNSNNGFQEHVGPPALATEILAFTSRTLANKIYKEKHCEADAGNAAVLKFSLSANNETHLKLKSMQSRFFGPSRQCAKISGQELNLISYGLVDQKERQGPDKVKQFISGPIDASELFYISKVEEVDCFEGR